MAAPERRGPARRWLGKRFEELTMNRLSITAWLPLRAWIWPSALPAANQSCQ